MERLQKVIAASGLCSRREAEVWITTGRVRVNGRVVTKLGTQVGDEDVLLVNNRPLPKPQRVVYAVNKPRGYICSRAKQNPNDHLVTELVPPSPVVYPVGRLDKESEGLILLTNDGVLSQALTHPKFSHAKTYRVLVRPESDADFNLTQALNHLRKGVKLGDGKANVLAASGRPHQDGLELTLTVAEGRHHLIRRLCATQGLEVRRLERTKVGTLSLAGLTRGHYRTLKESEIHALLHPIANS